MPLTTSIILLVEHQGTTRRSLILDAKWRSGRSNVLKAMESAHIYHDSLRLGLDLAAERPNRCILLLPGASDVESLGEPNFIHAHGVGAITEFLPHGVGVAFLKALIKESLTPLYA